MLYEELQKRILAEFERLLVTHGRGTQARLQRALGVSRSYFRQWSWGTRISLPRLLEALDVLGEDVFGFFARALRPADVTEFDLEFISRATKKTQPSYKTTAAKEVLEIVKNGPCDPPASAAQASVRSIDDLLGQIERLRYSDPKASLKLAKRISSEVSGVELSRALGEWASSLRALGRLEESEEVLRIAMSQVGDDRENRGLLADLIRRRASIEAVRGSQQESIRAADLAIFLSASVGDRKVLGRAFAARGLAAHLLDQHSDSHENFLSALLYLEEESDIVGVRINMAQNAQRMGDFCLRDKCLKAAFACEGVPYNMACELTWLRSEFDLLEGRFDLAATGFSGLVQKYWSQTRPIEAALATCLAVEARFKAGQLAEAEILVKKMTRFLVPLEKNEIVSGAIADLITLSLDRRRMLGKSAISYCAECLRQASSRPRPQPQDT